MHYIYVGVCECGYMCVYVCIYTCSAMSLHPPWILAHRWCHSHPRVWWGTGTWALQNILVQKLTDPVKWRKSFRSSFLPAGENPTNSLTEFSFFLSQKFYFSSFLSPGRQQDQARGGVHRGNRLAEIKQISLAVCPSAHPSVNNL